MKKFQLASLAVFATGMLTIFNSCAYFPSSVPDPYLVDVTRQKENYYYTPAVSTVPMLVRKNDFSMVMNGSLGENNKGGSVHGAFMPLKNLGIMTSYSWLKYNDGKNYIGRFANYETGAGYIGRISSYFHFETYGGIGSGKIENTHHTGYSNIKTNSFFLQPTIFVSDKNQAIQFGLVSKFSLTKFDITDTTFNNDREAVVTQQMQILHNNPSQLFWEPGFVLRFGWKFVQFNMGLSLSADLTDKELFRKKSLFTLGAVVKFNTSNNLKDKKH
jgi:hypothetical protein